jgi:hypothetical protein
MTDMRRRVKNKKKMPSNEKDVSSSLSHPHHHPFFPQAVMSLEFRTHRQSLFPSVSPSLPFILQKRGSSFTDGLSLILVL